MLNFLDNPLLFNFIRGIIAGEQENTKKFVQTNVEKYKCKRVLDICCGTGDFAAYVGDAKYLGLDLNSQFINHAKQVYRNDKNKKFLTADVLKHKTNNKQKFDCVLLMSTLHHFSDEQLDVLLKKVKREVKGVVIIADLVDNPPGILRKLMVKLDRGDYVRSNQQKINLVKKYFTIKKTTTIPSRLAVQFGMLCQS